MPGNASVRAKQLNFGVLKLASAVSRRAQASLRSPIITGAALRRSDVSTEKYGGPLFAAINRGKRALAAAAILLLACGSSFAALDKAQPQGGKRVGPERTDISQLNRMNRVSRRSNLWMNFTNYGYFGNYGPGRGSLDDPCRPGEWAPQCEFPGGSRVQYLFQGALWLGALIRAEGYEYPRVSVGTDGWIGGESGINEFNPGEGTTNSQTNGFKERSTLPLEFDCLGNYIGGFQDSAVSEQDFVCDYADTLTEDFWVQDDPIDGPHIPLGIKITQKSYAWTYNYAQNFIIIDWEIENIAGNYLKNLYVGLYIDADVGWRGEQIWHEDDICGFQQWFYYNRPDGQPDSSVINTAWIADNDGRPRAVAAGNDFTSPGVTGVRVVRAPNPKLKTSFNWWISNGATDLDFGPSWDDDAAPGGWTGSYGTPMGDVRKYFVLKNREFDYDQPYVNDPDWIGLHPQEFPNRLEPGQFTEPAHNWKVPGVQPDDTPQDRINDLANGYDTRYLLSWGPLGIFDHVDLQGNRIYRLNPGEKFSMTIAYVAGDNFHDRNRAQIDNEDIDRDLFSFSSLRYNADWAARVYDNPMIDTPIYDWGNDHQPGTGDRDRSEGDGILDTGDGWFGEDVGSDGLFGLYPGDVCYVWISGKREERIYPGPDADGSENDGHVTLQTEDILDRPEYLDYTQRNEQLDFGDGHPDFQGPPPPPAPFLSHVSEPIVVNPGPAGETDFTDEFLTENVVLEWTQSPTEDSDYKDPFSRERDFEGYRIYVSNFNSEKDFAFLDEFDVEDYAYFSITDSLASRPVPDITGMPREISVGGERLFLKPVGKNLGVIGHKNLVIDSTSNDSDWTYYYIIHNAHAMVPRYYAVTAFDYGDYKTGTQPLETAKIANAVYIAPSGTDKKKVGVVPNPYRANVDYREQHGGVSWENRDDGTPDFFPQTDRRIYFYNLPKECLIRIYTLSGDLVDMVPHNVAGDDNQGWSADFAESWDLNSRNHQQVVAGVYLFTVENLTNGGSGDMETGKFVVIR